MNTCKFLSSTSVKAQREYADFLHADYGYSFSAWLGITLPVIETKVFCQRIYYRYTRNRYERSKAVIGEWC